MSVHINILDLLICPNCLGKLIYQKEGEGELWCRFDKLAFPIRKDIPVMLIEDARKLTLEELDQCK